MKVKFVYNTEEKRMKKLIMIVAGLSMITGTLALTSCQKDHNKPKAEKPIISITVDSAHPVKTEKK